MSLLRRIGIQIALCVVRDLVQVYVLVFGGHVCFFFSFSIYATGFQRRFFAGFVMCSESMVPNVEKNLECKKKSQSHPPPS